MMEKTLKTKFVVHVQCHIKRWISSLYSAKLGASCLSYLQALLSYGVFACLLLNFLYAALISLNYLSFAFLLV
jgi:hypothetical protein